MDKVYIAKEVKDGMTVFTNLCPFYISYTDPITKLQHIRSVGSSLCEQCVCFAKIEDDHVICKY